MDSRFSRDLRLLIWVGGATALVILGSGLLALRGAGWRMAPGVAREIAIVAGSGAAVLALAGAWAFWMVRRVKAGREPRPKTEGGGKLTPPGG
jgi:hypothetical protein